MKNYLECLLNQNEKPIDRIAGTIAANQFALDQGIDIIRVHDVKEAMQAKIVWQVLKKKKSNEKLKIDVASMMNRIRKNREEASERARKSQERKNAELKQQLDLKKESWDNMFRHLIQHWSTQKEIVT